MGAIAFERLRAGQVENLDLDAHPGLVRRSPLHQWAISPESLAKPAGAHGE
jgi:hypothetical protein